MRFLQALSSVVLAICVGTTLAVPTLKVHPGGPEDIVITDEDTVNATNVAPANPNLSPPVNSLRHLPISLVNNLPGGSQINAYVTGLDHNNRLIMLKPDGRLYYPSAPPGTTTPRLVTGNVAIPLGAYGTTKKVTLPQYISAARVWLAEGHLKFYTVYEPGAAGPSLVEPSSVNPSDPSANVNWGFAELTNSEAGGLYADVSYVDFVGLPLGLSLKVSNGPTQSAKGLNRGSVNAICDGLKAQSARDGQPWGNLCMVNGAGKNLRVISPFQYISINPSAFQNYWTNYINQVWTKYSQSTLTINTQTGYGNVACKVSGGQLQCAGDNRGYSKPSAADIFGCNSGPFAIQAGDNGIHAAVVPRLCAAFTRSTLLLPGGNVQPSLSASHYYATNPTSWYSKLVHAHEVDSKGYAFSYDDVTPNAGVNQAGLVASQNPELLTIVVGGPL